MLNLHLPFVRVTGSEDLIRSQLLDDRTFYPALVKDLKRAQTEVIIESAFASCRRVNELLPILQKLRSGGVRIIIITRDPRSNDCEYFREDSCEAVSKLQHTGLHVIFTKNLHRKLVTIDRNVLFEGSLNILSQSNSCEVMRRIESEKLAKEMMKFTGVDSYVC